MFTATRCLKLAGLSTRPTMRLFGKRTRACRFCFPVLSIGVWEPLCLGRQLLLMTAMAHPNWKLTSFRLRIGTARIVPFNKMANSFISFHIGVRFSSFDNKRWASRCKMAAGTHDGINSPGTVFSAGAVCMRGYSQTHLGQTPCLSSTARSSPHTAPGPAPSPSKTSARQAARPRPAAGGKPAATPGPPRP